MASVNRMLLQKTFTCSVLKTSFIKAFLSPKVWSFDTSSLLRKLPHLNSQIHLYSSGPESTANILSQSMLIFQDGVDIEELPVLVKRATSESFPFTSHSYTGQQFQEETEFDTTFRQDLCNCYSVNDVFRLLEVPSDKVRGISASLALQKLHVLKYLNTDWHQIHSFIRSAVMRELYDTVQQDVKLLSNSTLISLVECYVATDGFSLMCIDGINLEIQSRLGDGILSVEELLNLSQVLSKHSGINHKPSVSGVKISPVSIVSENSSRLLSNDGDEQQVKVDSFDKYCSKAGPQVRTEIHSRCSQLRDHVWVHLTSRYQDIDENTFAHILQALTCDRKNLVSLLEKSLAKYWISLSPEDVKTSLDNLVRLRANSTVIMTYFGRWAYVNIHQMSLPLLLSFLNAYIHFGFLNENLVKVMERCLSLKGQLIHTDVLALCVEYCRSCQYLSPLVMDAAASHFTQYAYSYEPLQLFVVLRAFGQLNYLPAQTSAFLKKVESCLWDRFDQMQETQLLEILGSFTFLDILPKNFHMRVSDHVFLDRIRRLNNANKSAAFMWLGILKNAFALNTSQDLEKNHKWLLARNVKYSPLYHDDQKTSLLAVRFTISQLLGHHHHHVLPVYGCCAVYLSSDGLPLKITSVDNSCVIEGQVAKKLAILLRTSDHFTVNTQQLLGVHAQKQKHLHKLGFSIVEVRAGHFMYTWRHSFSAGASLIKACLMPHINFSKLKHETYLADKHFHGSLTKEDAFWSWRSNNGDDLIADDDALFSGSSTSRKDGGVSVCDSGLLNEKSVEDDKTTEEPD
ncbi:unnamed protein product [Candidula unifasciata]|uniref:FAST kinase leucine-rich domain-containing protein n=1 Tax=Candidula unifasciata TaxID=100452 RepID=A0A8S3Z955_9EUPU|nr:unnamed protein product [Candidula unifasciata]